MKNKYMIRTFAVLLAVVLGGSGWTMLYSYLVWRGGDR